MNLSFRQIIALIVCFSFILCFASSSVAFANSNLKAKTIQASKQASEDSSDQTSKNKCCEELENEKLSNTSNQYSINVNLIKEKFNLDSEGSISFLSSPPFSPPNS